MNGTETGGTANGDGRTSVEPPDRSNGVLVAELWYEQVPDLADPSLLAALRLVSAEAEAQDESITIPHSSVTLELEDGVFPLVTAVIPASAVDHRTKWLPDVSQTWDWADAESAVSRATGSIVVTELMAHLFIPPQRVSAFLAVLEVLIEHTRPLAVSWPYSQRVTNPEQFDPSGLDGVINVRFFAISNDEGAMVMDTLGLQVFELPDVQCHYRDFNPSDIASMLFNTAVYLFDSGDVIDDGHTISGPRGDERFVCQHEQSLMDPPRIVLDVDLGEPYAAGKRS